MNKVGRVAMIFVWLFTMASINTYATHFTGGELTYKSLGSNKLQMHLKFYRDCNVGAAPADAFAIIGAFDFSNNLLQADTLNLINADTLPVQINEPCYHNSPITLCYEIVHYTGIIELTPPASGGIVFAYERCCLPLTLTNIDNPVGTGAGSVGIMLSTIISDVSFLNNNSSPTIVNDSNFVICLGVDFEFDQSCFDADGDSLEYKLITPYSTTRPGAMMIPFAPPYTPLTYTSGYSLNNVLGSTNDSLAISVDDGVLTGTASQLGQYVYGVRTREFRNGTPVGFVDRAFVLNSIVHVDTTGPTSILIENRLEQEISIYPNPSSSNSVFIEVPFENVHLTVVDMKGQAIHSDILSDGKKITLDNSWLPGMYSFRFEYDGHILHKKYIKLE